MKKILLIVIAILLISLSSVANIAQASSSATVASTVTIQSVSVSVGSGTVTYGTLATNTSESTIVSDLNDTQTVTNNGNVAEDFTVKGQNSANWTLAASAGSDQYVHKFCTSSCGTPPTNFSALTTSYQSLASNVAAAGTANLDLQITTPTSSSVTTQQTVDVTILAAAH